jgi:hypothetical protein
MKEGCRGSEIGEYLIKEGPTILWKLGGRTKERKIG